MKSIFEFMTMAWSEVLVQSVSPGDIAVMDLEPTVGHEQGGRRPNVVVSVPTKHRGGNSGLAIAIAVPLTTTARNYWTVGPLNRQGGLRDDSYALCHNIRAVSTDRTESITGRIDSRLLTTIRIVLKDILEIG